MTSEAKTRKWEPIEYFGPEIRVFAQYLDSWSFIMSTYDNINPRLGNYIDDIEKSKDQGEL